MGNTTRHDKQILLNGLGWVWVQNKVNTIRHDTKTTRDMNCHPNIGCKFFVKSVIFQNKLSKNTIFFFVSLLIALEKTLSLI